MSNDLNRFDLNLLVAFDTLMTERGVTRAGKVMGITQAAMSNTLRRLRDVFGDPLFVKSGLRMEPTARALELAGPVRRALLEVHQTLAQKPFDPAQSDYVFRIGMVDYAAAMLLPKLQPIVQKKAPGVNLEVVDVGGGVDDEIAALESATADLVFSRFQWISPKVMLHRLFETSYVCIHRSDHPLVKEGTLTLDAFLQAPHIHYYPKGMTGTVVDDMLAQMGKSRRIQARLHSLSLIPFILAESDFMAVMPEASTLMLTNSLALKVSKLPFETPKLRLAIAWHPRSDKSPSHIWLRSEIIKLFDSELL